MIEVELPQLDALRPQVVSLLVGVNDVVRRVSRFEYRANVERILTDLTARVGTGRIVVVTTPDYTVTPAGSDYGDPSTQSAGIRTNNEVITELATSRGIAVVDIFDISRQAAADPSLVADDGLHPSGVQYALWVERIAPVMNALARA